jgi:hypothetical protein
MQIPSKIVTYNLYFPVINLPQNIVVQNAVFLCDWQWHVNQQQRTHNAFLCFPLQQWLLERPTVLRYMYTAYLI